MPVELMTSGPPPPPPPPLPQFNATCKRLPPVSSTTQINNSNNNDNHNKTVPLLVNSQTNGNANNNFAVLCDEIKNGVKLKKCPVNNSEGIAKNGCVVNNDSQHTRSSSFDENTDNQVNGDSKDPKMVSVQAELIRRLQRRKQGIDDENQEQKILSPTLAMFVQNKTKPLKRDEAEDENSPKMISHAKRNFTVNRKNYSNGISSSLQSSPNSSEMDLSSDKSLSQTDLSGKSKMSNGICNEHHKLPIEVKIDAEKIEIPIPPPPITTTPVEPIIKKIYTPIVKNISPTPFVTEPQPTPNSHEVTKPLNIIITSSVNKTSSEQSSPAKLSPQTKCPSPIYMKSPSLSSKSQSPLASPSSIEYIPAEEKPTRKVSELCKNYSVPDSNTKVNDSFVHLNGNLTLKRPKQLPQTHQKISHGKPNYRTQTSTTLVSHTPTIAPPKSPVIHKTEVNIQPTMIVNEQKTTTMGPMKNQNFVSFSKELSSSPNRYIDKVVSPPKTESTANDKSHGNIMADLQHKQFLKDLIVDDLLEVKNIQFSIDPEKNDITIDLKIGMHLNARN